MEKLLGPKGEGYVVIQFIMFALILFLPGNFSAGSSWPGPVDVLGFWSGIVFILYGVAMIGLGILFLGRNLTAVPHPKADAQLVEGGIYAIVRHPIYSGIIVGAIGWGLFNNAEVTILLSLFLFLFFDWKTRREERMLAAKFAAYPAYQQRVRKLIPFLY